MFAVLRTALAVAHVLSYEVEDYEIVISALSFQLVVVLEQTLVVGVKPVVARVELRCAERRVVEEKSAAEVIDGLACLGQELVGEERHVVARLAEHLGEQRIVAPFAFLSLHTC